MWGVYAKPEAVKRPVATFARILINASKKLALHTRGQEDVKKS
jgi:hypothetical protein